MGIKICFVPRLLKDEKKNPSPRAIILEAVTDMKLNFTVNTMLSKRQFYVKEAEWKLDWTKVEVLTVTWSEQNIKPSQICGKLKNPETIVGRLPPLPLVFTDREQ